MSFRSVAALLAKPKDVQRLALVRLGVRHATAREDSIVELVVHCSSRCTQCLLVARTNCLFTATGPSALELSLRLELEQLEKDLQIAKIFYQLDHFQL